MTRPEDKTRIDFLASHKPQRFDDIVRARMTRTAPHPEEETKLLCEEERKERVKPQI